MNFQTLTKVETDRTYLDLAFSAAKKAAGQARISSFRTRLQKSRHIEQERIKEVENVLCRHLDLIVTSFPSFDDLSGFYQELLQNSVDIVSLKKALSKVTFVKKKIQEISKAVQAKVRRTTTLQQVNVHRRAYYGRVSSLVEQLHDGLLFLEDARHTMKGFPSVRTGMSTVALCGYPNVGKSTLLRELTGAAVKVSAYAFTTTRLLLGYVSLPYAEVQVIDTPGLLNRDAKVNTVEWVSYLAVRHLSTLNVFVWDLTGSCGYDTKKQFALFLALQKRFRKPCIIYLSKNDLLDTSIVRSCKEEHKDLTILTTKEELISFLSDQYRPVPPRHLKRRD